MNLKNLSPRLSDYEPVKEVEVVDSPHRTHRLQTALFPRSRDVGNGNPRLSIFSMKRP